MLKPEPGEDSEGLVKKLATKSAKTLCAFCGEFLPRRYGEPHSARRVLPLRRFQVQIRQRNLRRGPLIENPQGLPDDGIILDFHPMTVTKYQHRWSNGYRCHRLRRRCRQHRLLLPQVFNLLREPAHFIVEVRLILSRCLILCVLILSVAVVIAVALRYRIRDYRYGAGKRRVIVVGVVPAIAESRDKGGNGNNSTKPRKSPGRTEHRRPPKASYGR